MGKKIYKYLGPDTLKKAFARDGYCSLKCSYPKDYNDPYELFLTINFDEEPELLSFYNEIIREIPQNPTTCFSKSPIVTPMWAHYAHTLTGFVIEFDEDALISYLPHSNFEDIDYRDDPDPQMSYSLRHAHITCKPRHTYFFRQAVFFAAYFTKNSCWNYEKERRLVVRDNDITEKNENMILCVPINCVSALISGPRTDDSLKNDCSELSKKLSCDYYEMQIGRSTSTPYFVDKENETLLFNGDHVRIVEKFCDQCREPLHTEASKCPLCCINDFHEADAAHRNPMRMLAATGQLESYFEDMEKIGRS